MLIVSIQATQKCSKNMLTVSPLASLTLPPPYVPTVNATWFPLFIKTHMCMPLFTKMGSYYACYSVTSFCLKQYMLETF